MRRLFNDKLLILKVHEGIRDLYLRGFGLFNGYMEITVKNAAGKSKRKTVLTVGNFIGAVLYRKNRVYLSDFEILKRPYTRYYTSMQYELALRVLHIMEHFALEPDGRVFNRLFEQLENDVKGLVKLLMWLMQHYGILYNGIFRCSGCRAVINEGYTDYNTSWCPRCVDNRNGLVFFDLKTPETLLRFVDPLIGYNSPITLNNVLNALKHAK